MKTLKTLIFAGLCTIAVGTVAQSNILSQNNTPVPQQRTDYIKNHVNGISSDQESRILSIEQSCSTAMQGAHSNNAKDSIRKSTDTQMKTVLTPDQYTQYKKIKKNLPKEAMGSY
jgi:hypothetical protein